MLQKIHWLGQIQGENIHQTQEFRTLFCNHKFLIPYPLTFVSPAFIMVDGGLVSNTYAWTLAINNCSIFAGPGSFSTSADHVSEQIRRFLILRMNLFFGQSPEEVERHCNMLHPVGNNLIPQKILPDIFTETRKLPHKEMLSLNSWFQKVLSLPREKYKIVCQALAAYERALHVLSSDAALSYSLLVFVIEALANSHSDYHATWDDIRGEPKERFNALFEDGRISSIDTSWIDDFREVLVDTIHPGATRRFTNFALAHISNDLYSASNSNAKSPLRRSRIHQSIQNAYILRSSFSHALTPLTQLLIGESYRAEEIEGEFELKGGKKVKTSYLTLRGLFRVVRSILLEFIEQQEVVDLRSYNWTQEPQYGLVEGARDPAYVSMKNSEGELLTLEAQYAKNWFEDILVIYQDNYIERLHEQFSKNQTDSDVCLGIATSGSMAGRMLFRFDTNPSYNWQLLKQQALQLIAWSDKIKKVYLQAIALLCAHLATMDGAEEEWDSVLKAPAFDTPLFELERFVVDVIHNTTSCWSCKQAEKVFENHLKNTKIFIPTRVEIACMLELAKLSQNEGLDEERRKWLNAAYGDTALYPNLQNLIHNAMNSDDMVVQPQEALNIF
ncbi:hypothetical protein [Microcoleus sp. N9_A1]|uniref:hypothetical protein n=1 Tax=Microcoleus sp. N9_A1 TaxID=3055380 RepID=UPI002FCF9915